MGRSRARRHPEVILLADQDDEGARALFEYLRSRGVGATAFWLALPDSEYDIDFDGEAFSIRGGDTFLTNEHFSEAQVVIYRRRRLDDTPPVRSTLETPAECAFAEREWRAAFDAVLHHACRGRGVARWLNSPAATLATENKLVLLADAAEEGFRVPPFVVSSRSRLPPALGSGFVAKAINRNELITPDLSYRTSVLDPDVLETVTGERVSCPSLIQARVRPRHELRCYYCLGSCVAIRVLSSTPYEDVRLVDPASLTISAAEVPDQLAGRIDRFCRAHGLHYCVFDLLAGDGDLWLTDVTPNGSWSWYEKSSAVPLTSMLGDAVRRSLGAP